LIDSKSPDVKTESVSSALEPTPFPIKTSHGRKYVRVELSSPVGFRLLTCKNGKLKLSKDRTTGEILNLGEGGMLLLIDSPVTEDGFMILTLNLNKLVVLDGVLGKIKRVEHSGEEGFLVGVEFTSKDELKKLTSSKQIERLPVRVVSFGHKLKEIISSYLRTTELATR